MKGNGTANLRVRERLDTTVRERLTTPAEEIASTIKYAVEGVARKKIHYQLNSTTDMAAIVIPKYTFAITAQGIVVTATWICYRENATATWEELAKSNFRCLNRAVGFAHSRLQSLVRKVRNGQPISD